MMKFFGTVWLLIVQVLLAAELEVRAYRVDVEDLKHRVDVDERGVGDGEEGVNYEGLLLKKAPFESRFLSEGDGLLDFTGWAKSYGLLDGDQGKAVYNEKTGRLVVRAEERDHYFLADYLEHFLVGQMRFEFRLLKMPGVELGRMDLALAKVEEVGKVVAGMGGLCQSGRASEFRSAGAMLTWEGECQSDFPDVSWEARSNLDCQISGMKFELRHCVTGVMGLPTIMELGSFDGKSTLVGIWKVKQVLADGSDFDDWIEVEKPRNVVEEKRVKGWLHQDREWVPLESGKRYQRFTLPPTFETFIGNGDGVKKSVRELLEQNGVSFEEDDRVQWIREAGVLVIEASPLAMEMIEGITIAAGQDGNVGMIGGSYALVESAKKLEVDDLKGGEFRILRKICVSGPPGQSNTMRMGKRFLAVESEFQTNSDDHFVEARFILRSGGEVVLNSEVESDAGNSVLLKQEKVGEKWRTWVGTFSARYFEDSIEEAR